MCRKNQITGACLVSFGLGMLVSLLIGGAFTVILSLAAIVLGIVLAGKK